MASAVAETSPNSAVSTIKRWLSRTPQKCTSLVLSVQSETSASILGTWEGGDAKPGLAVELVEAIDAHATATQQHCVATLDWRDDAGRVLQSRSVRRTYNREQEDTGQSLSGSHADQAAQAQRHLEQMTRLYYQGIGGSIQQILKVSEATLRMLESQQVRAEQVEQERDALREALDATIREVPQTLQDDAQKAQLVQLFGQVLPLLAAGTSKPAPQAPPKPPQSNGSA